VVVAAFFADFFTASSAHRINYSNLAELALFVQGEKPRWERWAHFGGNDQLISWPP